uniref:Uncharacterized protein n=1 Tax=Globodera rostochiensis TaxID=31243 RepID=A0A914HW17_GLORO
MDNFSPSAPTSPLPGICVASPPGKKLIYAGHKSAVLLPMPLSRKLPSGGLTSSLNAFPLPRLFLFSQWHIYELDERRHNAITSYPRKRQKLPATRGNTHPSVTELGR